MTDKIIGRMTGAVAEIVFNNPEKHNATSLEMWQKVGDLVTEYAKDPNVRVLVVSGAGGKAFVSGADISKFESERASKEANDHYATVSGRAYEGLYNFPKPTIAKVQGFCIGGGMNVAACCDMRIAAKGSQFGVPAGRLGLGYGYDPVKRISEIIGLSHTMEMIYTAKRFTAEEALSLGLINRLCADPDDLEKTVADTAALIAGHAPLTIALVKASARELTKPESQRNFAKLKAMVDACSSSEDYIEGRRAFMEKRNPVFKGR